MSSNYGYTINLNVIPTVIITLQKLIMASERQNNIIMKYFSGAEMLQPTNRVLQMEENLFVSLYQCHILMVFIVFPCIMQPKQQCSFSNNTSGKKCSFCCDFSKC